MERSGCVWRAVLYFSLWATRLSGFLPDLAAETKLEGRSREIARDMLRSHVSDLAPRSWNKDTAADLRRFLIRQMENHVERHFITPAVREAL